MKYSGGSSTSSSGISTNNPSTLFCEQVSTVTSLFEKWNDCERTVVMYALLKRLRYPSLKFLQYSIENNLTQNFLNNSNSNSSNCTSNNNSQTNLVNQQQKQQQIVTIDLNANNASYLQKLISAYKTLHIIDGNNCANLIAPQIIDNDSARQQQQLIYESDSSLPTSSSNTTVTTSILSTPTPTTMNTSPSAAASTLLHGNNTNSNNSLITNNGNNVLTACHKQMCNKKENILNDILAMLPLLKPGNDEAKIVYLSLIPLAVEDTVRQIVSTELVQQIFSYLLIHPAISNEDRRSLSHWLRHLEDHIQSSFSDNGVQQQSFYVLTNNNSNTDGSSLPLSTAAGTSASIVNNSINQNTWQAVAPPSQSMLNFQNCFMQPSNNNNSILMPMNTNNRSNSVGWNMTISQLTDSLCDDLNTAKMTNDFSKSAQNSLGLLYDSNNHSVSVAGENANDSTNLNLSISNDDHHVSFSKNGTEIIDFDINQGCDKCNTQIVGYSSVMLCCDHQQQLQNQQNSLILGTPPNSIDMMNTTLPIWSLDSKIKSMKTRRSNSLTTPTAISTSSSSSSSTSSVITVNDNCSSNSSENLSQYAQKPRSYSLCIENPRGTLISGGSDTRLDDLKQPSYMKFQTHNIGMSNIGQWLKSLRLHKYIGLFTNMTYENMLEITEDYLQSLGVTKGASHKLAICIDKLKDRYCNLVNLEQDLLAGKIAVVTVIEELTNIVLTPMKPVDMTSNNIALKFLHVLELAFHTVVKKDVNSIQDEECVNALLWILERSIHSEAFVAHNNQLKEQKFKLSKLKMQYSPKIHPQHSKNGSNGSLNKPRWNNKSRKNDSMITKGGSIDRITNRKNSNDINYTLTTLQQQQNSLGNLDLGNNSSNSNDIEKFHQLPSSSSASTNMSSTSIVCQQSTSSLSHFTNNGVGTGASNQIVSPSTPTNVFPQYKSSSYPNFPNPGNNSQKVVINQQHQQQKQQQQQQQLHHQQQQQQQQHKHHHQIQQQQIPQQQQQYRHRHSLNNLIVVSSKPQQMLFKQNKNVAAMNFPKMNANNLNGHTSTTDMGKNRRSSITKSTIITGIVTPSNVPTEQSSATGTAIKDDGNIGGVVGGTSSIIKQNCEKTFAEIIAVSSSNSSSSNISHNIKYNSINVNSLSNCGNLIGNSNCCSQNLLSSDNTKLFVDNNCCNSGLITSSKTAAAAATLLNNSSNDDIISKTNNLNDINRSLEQLEFLCLQMTEQAIN